MTRSEVHDELTLLGVCSEVHNLVDDLDLTLREIPLGERLACFPKSYKPLESKNHVYQPHTTYKETTGRLFADDGSPVRQVRGVPFKGTKRIRGPKLFRSRKSR